MMSLTLAVIGIDHVRLVRGEAILYERVWRTALKADFVPQGPMP